MTNPWLEWWEEVEFQWLMLSSSVVLRQLAVLGLALAVALILDRILERYRARWLGDVPERRKIRTILWAAKFPILALIFGHLALSMYSATGRPVYTLGRLVTLFWFILAYALVAKALAVLMPPSDARRIIRRVLLPLLAVLGILHLVGLLAALWAWASEPVVTLAGGKLTLANIGLALVIVVAFWLTAKSGRALFLRAILPRTETDPNLARSVAGFVQFAVVVVGLWIAIASLGLELSSLTLLISALTVGIGFGLQDVIKNFMGGIILLGEGHVRPNEVFGISGETGVVERIGLRSTTLRTLDGAQVIIPNADLITNKVSDLTDSRRVQIHVGVSCDADPRLAERLLLELAAAHPDVVADPEPSVFFTGLGESSFDYALYCFVEDRDQVTRTQSDLHYAVVETFRQHDLEMPYRQLDLHLRSSPWGRSDPPPPAE
jgi:small-conductance mechanosensitive channel